MDIDIPDEPATRRYGIVAAATTGIGGYLYNRARDELFNRASQYRFTSGVDRPRILDRIGPIPERRPPNPKLTEMRRSRGLPRRRTVGATAPVYAGRLTGVVRKNRTSKVAKNGYRMEHEIKGIVADPNCARLLVNAYPCDQMLVGVWIAVLRYMFKKVCQQEYSCVDQQVETGLGWNSIQVEWNRVTSKGFQTPTISTFVIATSTTTLKGLASEVARQDLVNRQSTTTANLLPSRMRFINNEFTQSVNTGAQWFRIDQLLISLYGKAEVNIQNATNSAFGPNASTDRTDTNPVTGNIVFGSGQTCTPQVLDCTNQQTATVVDFPFSYENRHNGTIVSNISTSGNWRSVQPASQFRYAKKQMSFNLNPGETRMFSIGYKWTGYLSTYLGNYFHEAELNGLASPLVTDPPVHQGTDGDKPGLNRWALIQMEKRIDATNTAVGFHYQVDHHFGVRVVKGVKQLSMNVDFGQATKSALF